MVCASIKDKKARNSLKIIRNISKTSVFLPFFVLDRLFKNYESYVYFPTLTVKSLNRAVSVELGLNKQV